MVLERRGWGELPPFCRSWILIVLVVLTICFMAVIPVFGLENFAADLFIRVLVSPLPFPFSHQLFLY